MQKKKFQNLKVNAIANAVLFVFNLLVVLSFVDIFKFCYERKVDEIVRGSVFDDF